MGDLRSIAVLLEGVPAGEMVLAAIEAPHEWVWLAEALLDAAGELADEAADPLAVELFQSPLGMGAVRKLQEMDVPLDFVGALYARGDIGAARVNLSRDGQRFDPHGPTARLLVAVREHGRMIDLVAAASHDPDQWALRTGEGWCLGHDILERAERGAFIDGRAELRIFATPIDWLRGRGAGLCVLDWNAAALAQLRALGERVTLRVDAGAGERLRALLTYGGVPRVKERAPVRRDYHKEAA